jgi:hypothetical protein
MPLIIGGVVQGLRLNDASVNFLNVVNLTKPFLGMSTLGVVLLLAGSVALALNAGWIVCAGFFGCCLPGDARAMRPERRRR